MMKHKVVKTLVLTMTLALLAFSLTACSGGSSTTSDSATGTATTLSGTAQ